MPATISKTPPLIIKSQFPSVFEDDVQAQKDPASATSYSSSPEIRPHLQGPIPEEDEDETSSETAEPLTPTDHLHQGFADKIEETGLANGDIPRPPLLLNTKMPTILSTSATPPGSSGEGAATQTPSSAARSPRTPAPKRQGSSSAESARRTFSGFFKRSNSQSGSFLHIGSDSNPNVSDPALVVDRRRMSTSASTTRSNTPPSPIAPAETFAHPTTQVQVQEPSPEMLQKKKHRSTTGLSIRDKIKKMSFTTQSAQLKPAEPHRNRSASVDLESSENRTPAHENPELGNLERSVFGISAEAGIGLKSRRLSLSLPDDFLVVTDDLYNVYKDQSRIIGRRGKNVGKGATANVKLMIRKGTEEVYAVKEFRGKGTKEMEEEYVKKIKSEYSIAKSAHHPNIVETISLCRDKDRWNHVMEYCDGGDLFSLVQQKYLSKADHEKDRMCLFKQLLQGLNYLHSNGIAHRDIKLENLLITKDSKLKISDFGVSDVFCGIHPGLRSAGGQCGRGMEEIRLCTPGVSGSKPYLSPEVLAAKEKYDPRALDVWGAGTVMLHIICSGFLWDEATVGKFPVFDELVRGWAKWNTKHTDQAGHDIPAADDGDYPHVSFFDTQINPPSLRKLLLKMLNPDPSKRITISQISAKGWVKHIECCQVDSYEETTTIIDASKAKSCSRNHTKVVQHNHLPPHKHLGHALAVRLPGSTEM